MVFNLHGNIVFWLRQVEQSAQASSYHIHMCICEPVIHVPQNVGKTQEILI